MKFPDTIVDYDFLESLEDLQMEGKPDLVRELYDYFQLVSPTKVGRLTSAAEHGQYEDLRTEAHSFKSTCHNLGARRLATVCQELEDLAAAENGVRLRFAIERLQIEFKAASLELGAVMAIRAAKVG